MFRKNDVEAQLIWWLSPAPLTNERGHCGPYQITGREGHTGIIVTPSAPHPSMQSTHETQGVLSQSNAINSSLRKSIVLASRLLTVPFEGT